MPPLLMTARHYAPSSPVLLIGLLLYEPQPEQFDFSDKYAGMVMRVSLGSTTSSPLCMAVSIAIGVKYLSLPFTLTRWSLRSSRAVRGLREGSMSLTGTVSTLLAAFLFAIRQR